MCRRWLWPAWLLAALVIVSCAEPPNKEMDQAQGALDAARAAGAEQYASDEFRAAMDALARSRESVSQRDYRMALNSALDSRERAQNAARLAADTKAQVRGDVERTMAEVATLMAAAHARLSAAEKTRMPRRLTRQTADALNDLNMEVQKAGEAANRGDYLEAQRVLKDVKPRITAATTPLEPQAPAGTGRRRGANRSSGLLEFANPHFTRYAEFRITPRPPA